ncbi:hypothetical protein MYX78_06430 [Acidobacteria bacterium AH-259-G07]|nr:hypothetical protein [Acidobacteria bacterium AH-259-G07]
MIGKSISHYHILKKLSVHAGYRGGELLTRPLISQGDNLVLNYATSAAGSIRIEVQDEKGNPLPGFALEESPLIGETRLKEPSSGGDPQAKPTHIRSGDWRANRFGCVL